MISENQKSILNLLNCGEAKSLVHLTSMVYLASLEGLNSYQFERGISIPVSPDFFNDLRRLHDLEIVLSEIDVFPEVRKKFKLLDRHKPEEQYFKIYNLLNNLSIKECRLFIYKKAELSKYEIGDKLG